MNLISVIVPIYKTEKYINRCVDTILNQTYRNLEIILVDDGSPDRCPQICEEYAKKDKRIKVIHKENGGLSDARNAGLNIASGDYISFIDGDDYIHPQTFEILLDVISKTESEIVCFHYQFIDPQKTPEFERYYSSDIKSTVIDSNEFLHNFEKYYRSVSWISACTKIYSKNVFKVNRFPYGLVDEDSYMLHHAIFESTRVARIEEKLYYYVWTEGSISRSDFSPKRFDKNGANLDRVEFFKKIGIKSQEDYFKREYLLNTLKMYYLVKNAHPQFMKDFQKYILEYRKNIKRFIKHNDKMCKMEKIIYYAFAISPKITEKLYNKYLK